MPPDAACHELLVQLIVPPTPYSGECHLARLAHAEEGSLDERVEAGPVSRFQLVMPGCMPAQGVAVGLRDLRVAARQQNRLPCGPLGAAFAAAAGVLALFLFAAPLFASLFAVGFSPSASQSC